MNWKIGDKVKTPDKNIRNAVISEIINNRLVKIECEMYFPNSREQIRQSEITVIANTLIPVEEEYKNSNISEINRFGQLTVWKGQEIEIVKVDTDLSKMYRKYAEEEIDLNPEYQRELVWTDKQKQDYILAILKQRAKITPVIIEKLTEQGTVLYEILDGKQRLTALFDYIDNKYPLQTGEYFKDLSEKDMNVITHTRVSYTRQITMYITERFTKLIYCAYMNTKYKEYIVLNDVYEAMWGTENLSGNEGLLKLINILEKVLDPTNIIIARNMKKKIGKNLFQ